MENEPAPLTPALRAALLLVVMVEAALIHLLLGGVSGELGGWLRSLALLLHAGAAVYIAAGWFARARPR